MVRRILKLLLLLFYGVMGDDLNRVSPAQSSLLSSVVGRVGLALISRARPPPLHAVLVNKMTILSKS